MDGAGVIRGYGAGVDDLVALWGSKRFATDATLWVDGQLEAARLVRTGPLVLERVRFWSAVFHARVPAAPGGRVWLKATNPGQAFEGPVLAAVSVLEPDHFITPLAVEVERGWVLLPDGGRTLQEAMPDERVWADLLGQVARVQRRLSARCRSPLPVPALPLGSVVGVVGDQIERLASCPASDPQHLSRQQVGVARTGLVRLEQAIGLLAGLGVADSLQFNDVQDGNTFLPSAPGGPFRLSDLGDAFWAHPFAALSVPLRRAAGVRLADPLPMNRTVLRLARVYFDQWPGVAAGEAVIRAADRLGAVHRALSWSRLLKHTDTSRLTDPPRVGNWLLQAVAA